MLTHEIFYWGGALLWSTAGFVTGFLLGRHERGITELKEKVNGD